MTTDDAIVGELRKLAAGERGAFAAREDRELTEWLDGPFEVVTYEGNAAAWLRIAEAVQLQRAVTVLEANGDDVTIRCVPRGAFGKWRAGTSTEGAYSNTLAGAINTLAAHLRPDPHAETRQRIAELRARADALEAEIQQ